MSTVRTDNRMLQNKFFVVCKCLGCQGTINWQMPSPRDSSCIKCLGFAQGGCSWLELIRTYLLKQNKKKFYNKHFWQEIFLWKLHIHVSYVNVKRTKINCSKSRVIPIVYMYLLFKSWGCDTMAAFPPVDLTLVGLKATTSSSSPPPPSSLLSLSPLQLSPMALSSTFFSAFYIGNWESMFSFWIQFLLKEDLSVHLIP